MINRKLKIRNGFDGEKLISIPTQALRTIASQPVYITHIGYYPTCRYHYRRRRTGCEDNILFYCLQGKGYYVLDGIKFVLKANQYVIIPATTKPISYWADLDDPWSIYWVHFTGNGLQSFNETLQIGMDNSPVNIPFNEEGIHVWNKMYDSLSRGYNIPNMTNANLCLYYFLSTFIYPRKHNIKVTENIEKDIVEKTIDYMSRNLDRKLSVKDMASLNNLSESHFFKFFRTSIGMSPINYFIYLKMQKACRLLHTTDMRVYEIATILGYDDPYYFSRIFKKTMNFSPEEYKISVKEIMNLE